MTITATELRTKVIEAEGKKETERKNAAIEWVNARTSELINLAECGLTSAYYQIPKCLHLEYVKEIFTERGFRVKGDYLGFRIEW